MERYLQQQRADHPALRHPSGGRMPELLLHAPRREPLLDQPTCGEVANGSQEGSVSDVIEGPFDVGIDDPRPRRVRPGQAEEFLDRVMTSPAGAKPVATPLKPCFPE